MTQTYRLPTGGRIDRAAPVRFTFDGAELTGFAGDTVASALVANGVRLVGRSFKYHRPRGLLAAGPEEPNALMELDRGGGRYEPNARATTVALTPGLDVRSQNVWPRLHLDLGAATSAAAPLLPAGFYYKTFLGPKGAWERLYEPAIRRMAGLGRPPRLPDPDRYAARYAHCDVLVVGAGPAGLAAALAAADRGARVILCDEQAEPGGALLATPGETIDGRPAWDWLAGALSDLHGYGERVRVLPRTTAFGYFAQNMVGLAERLPPGSPARERLWRVRAGHVVLAAGAIERPLLFTGNDRPGVMLAHAARRYASQWAALPGRSTAVFAAHDSGWDNAFALQDAGAAIAAIIDPRPAPPADLLQSARQRGIEVLRGHGVAKARGRRGVTALRVAPRSVSGALDMRRVRELGADLLMVAGGWTPSVHLFSQSRGRARWDAALDAFVPGAPVQAMSSAGACQGTYDTDRCLAEGYEAGGGEPERRPRGPVRRTDAGMALLDATAGAAKLPNAFVDLQNDVKSKDIALAVQEGFRSVEHVKRYTTSGMATDQGKTSNMLSLAVAAAARGVTIPQAGLTTFRAPFTPVSFGTLAGAARGDLFDPIRRTPTHDWAVAAGAGFEEVGQWRRARWFPQGSETMDEAVRRECRAVRSAAGVFDASTLGKIEVVGPDAARFLDLMYVNAFASLAVGRCRYGLMLREDGYVFDDGVVARLAPDRFHVTTTTGGAARVLHHMEDYLQTEFPHLQVWLTSITEQWATIAIQGPRARDVLAPLTEGADLAMPHMSVRDGRVCGAEARVFRVSFTGELGYEVNVPADYGLTVWEALLERGRPLGVVPYGTETMHVLRAEKGYVIVGQETDGTVAPADLGLPVGKAKPDFVGKRSLARSDMQRKDRLQLVGLVSSDGRTVLEEGAQLVETPGSTRAVGHVTSSYWSDAAGRPVALALVAGGKERHGARLVVPMPGGGIEVEVAPPVAVDPEGVRLHA